MNVPSWEFHKVFFFPFRLSLFTPEPARLRRSYRRELSGGNRMTDWNSEVYLKFASERTQPAIDLARRLTAPAPRRILDLGCGPGNSTVVLKEFFPAAELLGVDNSPAMIEKAKRDHPDLSFRLFDANDSFRALGAGWDVIFSNACLQWVPDHPTLLIKLLDALAENGELAVQIPLQTKAPFHALLHEKATSKQWAPFFPVARKFHILDELEYCELLQTYAGEFSMWETDYFHILESPRAVLEWYRGTGLRPYLNMLPPEKHPEFEQEILSGIESLFPRLSNGSVVFRFPRLFFTARKKA